METKKVKLRYSTVVACAKEIVKQLKEREFSVDIIVPVIRGGMVPAALLSDLLQVKVIYPIHCSRYDGMKELSEPRVLPFNYPITAKNVLLVDDILDTGKTFEICQVELKKRRPHKLLMASLLVRENSVRPSFWSDEAKQGEWIVFPWELTEFQGD